MLNILVASQERHPISDFVSVFRRRSDLTVVVAHSGLHALDLIKAGTFDLVVAQETLPDMTGLELIEKILTINPMVNFAACSSLDPDDFHQASEGMGVLMQLPVRPSQKDGQMLLERLKNVTDMMNYSKH